MDITLEVSDDKDVLLRDPIKLGSAGDDNISLTIYYAPQSDKYVAHTTIKSAYQTLKKVTFGTPAEIVNIVVDDIVGFYHPIVKEAFRQAGDKDLAFKRASVTVF